MNREKQLLRSVTLNKLNVILLVFTGLLGFLGYAFRNISFASSLFTSLAASGITILFTRCILEYRLKLELVRGLIPGLDIAEDEKQRALHMFYFNVGHAYQGKFTILYYSEPGDEKLGAYMA